MNLSEDSSMTTTTDLKIPKNCWSFFRTDHGRVHYYHHLSDTFKSQKSRQRALAHFAKQFGRVYITVPRSQIQ